MQDQAFRMPFAYEESFLGTPTEYDIPVMPRRLNHHWWTAQAYIMARG